MHKRNLFVRITAIVLCGIMLLGVVAAAFYAFAKNKFEELFGDEQHNYEVCPISDFFMGYTALATRRTEPVSDGDDADDILNSDG